MPKSKFLNQTEIAAQMGVSTRRIRQLEKEGYFKRNDAGFYDLAKVEIVFAAMNPTQRAAAGKGGDANPGEKGSLAAAKKKEAFWKAERAELIFKREAAKLISREELVSSCTAIGALLQSKMMNW